MFLLLSSIVALKCVIMCPFCITSAWELFQVPADVVHFCLKLFL